LQSRQRNRPDLHAEHPYAAIRFGQTVEADEILGVIEQRATYDRLMQFERKRLRWTLKT
jgi:DnaJ-class molecular chaperone